jgi:hypothetical protein
MASNKIHIGIDGNSAIRPILSEVVILYGLKMELSYQILGRDLFTASKDVSKQKESEAHYEFERPFSLIILYNDWSLHDMTGVLSSLDLSSATIIIIKSRRLLQSNQIILGDVMIVLVARVGDLNFFITI